MKPRDIVFLQWWGRVVILLLLALSIVLFISPANSQESSDGEVESDGTPPIVIAGPVEEINVNIITIYSINIQVNSADPILADLQIGDFVRVEGDVDDSDEDVLIIAVRVEPAEPNDSDPILVVGVVQEITAFIITVSGIDIILSPDDPLLDDIEIGDVIRVGGLIPEDLTVSIGGITIVAITVIIVDADDGTPTPEPDATEEPMITEEPAVTEEPIATEEVDDGDIIIVIEGPVQEININIIVIYDIEIALQPDDPVLTVIQIGDIIRVEGIADGGDVSTVGITIIAIEITFISVEVVIIDGFIWRDSGNCGNPPPEIVQAVGGGIAWLIRCDTPPPSVGGGGSDDDDDDDGGGGNRGGGNRGGGGGGDDDDD